MTIRQIAETAGCGINTVRRVGKMIFPEVKAKSNGKAIEYDENQCIAIMDKLPKSNYIADPTQMGNQMGNVDYEAIGKMIAVAVSAAMTPLLQELKGSNRNELLQIEHIPEKTSRAIFRQEVDKLVKLSKSDWSAIYNAVYAEMGYVYGVKIKARASNRKVRPMDVLESDGLMGKAIAITRQMIERFENGNN